MPFSPPYQLMKHQSFRNFWSQIRVSSWIYLVYLFLRKRPKEKKKIQFYQLKTTSLRHLFLQVTVLWHSKTITWMSPILLIGWGKYPLERKRENSMQSCGHRLHIWIILQFWIIWFLKIYQSLKTVFICHVYNSAFSIFFHSHTFCLSAVALYLPKNGNIQGRKYISLKVQMTTSL